MVIAWPRHYDFRALSEIAKTDINLNFRKTFTRKNFEIRIKFLFLLKSFNKIQNIYEHNKKCLK